VCSYKFRSYAVDDIPLAVVREVPELPALATPEFCARKPLPSLRSRNARFHLRRFTLEQPMLRKRITPEKEGRKKAAVTSPPGAGGSGKPQSVPHAMVHWYHSITSF
jgi:hypothetical protein